MSSALGGANIDSIAEARLPDESRWRPVLLPPVHCDRDGLAFARSQLVSPQYTLDTMNEMHDTTAPRPLAYEIAAYNDEELDRYLEENGRTVSVQDPENVSSEFVQRLRDKVRYSREAVQSRAVDLDQVAARLHIVSANTEPSALPPLPSPTPPPLCKEEQDLEDLQDEIRSYSALVEAGGRPPYPFHILEDFFKNPEQYLEHPAYHDIIMFWRGRFLYRDERTAFCACQLSRWETFRRLQHIIRERSVKSEWTLISAADWDSWEEYIERFGPKGGDWGFSDYAERMKERFAKYGFTQPYQLESDLTRQDKSTTWIEYLGYEYWFYNQYVSYVKRFQRRHDEAWNTLVNSGLLRPAETYHVVCDIERVFKDANEEESAEKALQSARGAVLAAEGIITKSRGSKGCRQAHRRRLLAAQSALNTAEVARESIKRRSGAMTDFIQRIKGYYNAQKDAERQKFLLRWIKQQITLIELESQSSESNHTDAGCTGNIGVKDVDEKQHFEGQRCHSGASQSISVEKTATEPKSQGRGKRKRSSLESPIEYRQSKRLKKTSQGGHAKSSALGLSDATGAAGDASKAVRRTAAIPRESKGTKDCLFESSRVSKSLRRSTRIAQQSKNATISAQMPTHLPFTSLEEVATRASAKAAKTTHPRSEGQHRISKSRAAPSGHRTLQATRVSKKTKREAKAKATLDWPLIKRHSTSKSR